MRFIPEQQTARKPPANRMGKGKIGPDHWVAGVTPGRNLDELDGVPEDVAREALRLAGHKLAVHNRFVKRGEEISKWRRNKRCRA